MGDEKKVSVPVSISFAEADYDIKTQSFIPQKKYEGVATFFVRLNFPPLENDDGVVNETFTHKPK